MSMSSVGFDSAKAAVKYLSKNEARTDLLRNAIEAAKGEVGDKLTKSGTQEVTKKATGFFGRIANFFRSLFGGGSKAAEGAGEALSKKDLKTIAKKLNTKALEAPEGMKKKEFKQVKDAIKALKETFKDGDKDDIKEAYKKLKKEGLLDAFA